MTVGIQQLHMSLPIILVLLIHHVSNMLHLTWLNIFVKTLMFAETVHGPLLQLETVVLKVVELYQLENTSFQSITMLLESNK